MEKQTRFVTPIFDTALDMAIRHVQDCFFQDNTMLTWKMMRKLVYVTANKKIIEPCEKFINETELHVEKQIIKRGYTQADVIKKQRNILDYLDKKNIELWKMIMLLLEDNNYFNHVVAPRYDQPKKPLSVNE